MFHENVNLTSTLKVQYHKTQNTSYQTKDFLLYIQTPIFFSPLATKTSAA